MDIHWMNLMELKIIKMVMIFQKLPGKKSILKNKKYIKKFEQPEKEKKYSFKFRFISKYRI